MCSAPNIPSPPPPPPPPPAVPKQKPQYVKEDPMTASEQRTAARLGTNQLVIPLASSLNIPS